MERGWTLQEGGLSSSCVVQLKGKPYQMGMSLRNLMPDVKGHDSPLAKVFVDNRFSLVLDLKRGLLEYKRQIMIDQWFPRARHLFKLLRTPLFVWIWNSLLTRSVTRKHDGVFIFASLLDFNVYPLRDLQQDKRLMSVILGCDELPLSLLYNRGPRVESFEHQGLGWIPRNVEGDVLVSGAILHKIRKRRTKNRLSYSLDCGTQNRNSLFILATYEHQPSVSNMEIFRVQLPVKKNSLDTEEAASKSWIVEIKQNVPSREPIEHNTIHLEAKRTYHGTCIVVDLACGTDQSRGYAGRGVCFHIVSRSAGKLVVQYYAPLVIWSQEQWVHEYPSLRDLFPVAKLLSLEAVPLDQELTMTMTYGT
jgi:hypothetical protein